MDVVCSNPTKLSLMMMMMMVVVGWYSVGDEMWKNIQILKLYIREKCYWNLYKGGTTC